MKSVTFITSTRWVFPQDEYEISLNKALQKPPLPLTSVFTEGMFRSLALAYSLIHLSNKWIIFITGWWLTLNNPTLTQTAQQIILFKLPIAEVKTFMLLSQITINFLPTHSIISYSCIDKSMEGTSQKTMGLLEEPTLFKNQKRERASWFLKTKQREKKNPTKQNPIKFSFSFDLF